MCWYCFAIQSFRRLNFYSVCFKNTFCLFQSFTTFCSTREIIQITWFVLIQIALFFYYYRLNLNWFLNSLLNTTQNLFSIPVFCVLQLEHIIPWRLCSSPLCFQQLIKIWRVFQWIWCDNVIREPLFHVY